VESGRLFTAMVDDLRDARKPLEGERIQDEHGVQWRPDDIVGVPWCREWRFPCIHWFTI
jgi:hypothetical protein